MWFLTSQMPVLSGGMNFVPFEITLKNFFSKIPMKYSKNGQKFAMSKNTSNMLFETCWTPCKKPHLSKWSRSGYTYFWMTRYMCFATYYDWHIVCMKDTKNVFEFTITFGLFGLKILAWDFLHFYPFSFLFSISTLTYFPSHVFLFISYRLLPFPFFH